MFDKLNTLINQNSYCTDCDEDDNDEVKSTNCYYYSTEEYKKAKFKTVYLFFYISLKYSLNTTPYRRIKNTT